MKRALQLVGRFESALSLPLVNQQLAAAAVRSRHFKSVNVYSFDNIGIYTERLKWGLYRGLPSQVAVDLSRDPQAIGHAFGHPTNFHSWLANYAIRVAGLIIEQDFVPPNLVAAVNSLNAAWAPSRYVAAVYKSQGVTHQIPIFPHGVGEGFGVKQVKRNSKFTFLNVSGLYHERKGIFELVEAFKKADLDADLLLVTPLSNKLREAIGSFKSIRVYSPDEPLGEAKLAHLLNKVHCYIAPSRGEGYGLLPCEARACLTPVALTNATGHMEHFRESIDIEIPVGPMGWAPSDLEDHRIKFRGRVPTIDMDGLVESLRVAYRDWDGHKARLEKSIRERPEATWTERLVPWAKWMASLREMVW